jgi:hypothetical protein
MYSDAATRSISHAFASGRYPGSQVLIRRLPMIVHHSGTLANPHSLTVAGAAQAWGTNVPAPASRLTRLHADGHLKAARTLPQTSHASQNPPLLDTYKPLAQANLTV